MFKLNEKINNMFRSAKGEEAYCEIMKTVNTHKMLDFIHKGVLIGFSGGADSVFLLSFLTEYKQRTGVDFKILCVHVNHGIRGEEADRDESFSLEFSNELGIEFHGVFFDVPSAAKKDGRGIEETARKARYSIFADIIKGRDDICAVAVAHNSNDNAETVIFNMLRGTGISGMCGIKPVRDNIVRPLITVCKEDIVFLLEEFEIPYVTDSTNLSSEYDRNYIRNEILPKFHRLSPSPVKSIGRMSSALLNDLSYIDDCANAVISMFDGDLFPVSRLRALHSSVLVRVFSKLATVKNGVSPEENHFTALIESINDDNFSISIPGKYNFVCQRGVCFFEDKGQKKLCDNIIFTLNKGENKIEGTNLVVYVGNIDKSLPNVYNFSIQASISSVIINRGLILRLKKDGDSYKYGGITHKLKKVFNDRGIPPFKRSLIPVICDSEGILWVPGLPVRDGASETNAASNTVISVCYKQAVDEETEMYAAFKQDL